MSVTVLVGLGRETRAWLTSGHPEAGDLLVLDERDVDPADPALAHVRGRLTVADGVDLDGALTAALGDVDPREVSLVVRSPGASPYRPVLAALRAAGAPTVTPTGWWLARDTRPGLVAVSGTKGKSTTSAMTAHVLRAAGHDVALCGNIGQSPLTGVEHAGQTVVVELSSYQITDLDARLPVAGLTTLLRDHVPWHGSVDRYHADKLRLLDLAGRRLASPAAAAHPAVAERVDAVAASCDRDRLTRAVRAAGLVGDHLVDDAALAVALADAVLVETGTAASPGDLLDALASFTPLPHRLTPLGWAAGRRWVNDSIATVPEAAIAAIAAYRPEGPVTLLLGGDDRGQSLDALVRALADAEASAVLLRPLGDRLAPLLAAAGVTWRAAADLAEAVEVAATLGPAGGTVLLSPAASSFSSHRDFVHRGEHFTELVAALAGRATAPRPG